MTIQGMIQVQTWVLSPLTTPTGERGILIEFHPTRGQATTQPVRVALHDRQAAEFQAQLKQMLSDHRDRPSGPQTTN
jgi:hypothetical protein